MTFTHYSMFVAGRPAEDFAPIEDLPALLRRFHEAHGGPETHCQWGRWCLHPDGAQLNLCRADGLSGTTLILYTESGARNNLRGCLAEGNSPKVGDPALLAD